MVTNPVPLALLAVALGGVPLAALTVLALTLACRAATAWLAAKVLTVSGKFIRKVSQGAEHDEKKLLIHAGAPFGGRHAIALHCRTAQTVPGSGRQ